MNVVVTRPDMRPSPLGITAIAFAAFLLQALILWPFATFVIAPILIALLT